MLDGILRVVSQHERLQAEEILARRVAIEVDAQSRLHAAAAAGAARPDADVAQRLIAPPEVGRVVRVVQVVVFQRLPVLGVHGQANLLQNACRRRTRPHRSPPVPGRLPTPSSGWIGRTLVCWSAVQRDRRRRPSQPEKRRRRSDFIVCSGSADRRQCVAVLHVPALEPL